MKDIVRNVLYAVCIVLVFAFASEIFMRVITHHNQELTVPDFAGMTLSQASRAAERAGVRLDVVDSIYVKRFPKGAVVRQEPKALQKVKKGRRIMLTINAVSPKKVPMPNLVGYSLRSAHAELVSRGLALGRLVYVADMATNNVLNQKFSGRDIAPGTMIATDSKVDLVLGLSPDDNFTRTPVLYGQKYRSAVESIHDHSLNVGRMAFDREIRTYQDSLNAVVYRQIPDPNTLNTMGMNVTVYLTLDEGKVPEYKMEVYNPELEEEEEE